MRRISMKSQSLNWMAMGIAMLCVGSSSTAMGQFTQHAGFTYYQNDASPQGYPGYGSPHDIMQVGFAGNLLPILANPSQPCEAEQLAGCEGECGNRRGMLGNLLGIGSGSGCIFCGGSACGVCMNRLITLPELFDTLRPYSGAGLSAMRWYDASAEATFLSHSQGGATGVATTDGISGNPVLSFSDAATGDSLKSGLRLSAAVMFGPGGNMEVTYMGGNEWDQTATVDSDPAGSETLYSMISLFGTSPNGGFDDTDRSISQTIRGESKFHSGEWNYRRRSIGDYGRFQTSWLVGLRYVRFDNTLNYSTLGALNNTINSSQPRFFSSNDKVKNNLYGPQAGVDLWWNMRPGINLGIGVKGAWVQNDAKRQTIMTGNSLSGFATPGTVVLEETRRKGTVLGELEATLIYRLNESWAVKASYHLLAADDVVFGNVDVAAARDFVSGGIIREPSFIRDSLVVQGATIGAEYMW